MDQRPLCPRPCLHPECSARRRAALEPTVTIEPTPKVKQKAKIVPAVTNTGNTGAVTNAVKDTTNAARQSRWRSKQDVVALRGQAKERMKGLRARRKVGKAVVS